MIMSQKHFLTVVFLIGVIMSPVFSESSNQTLRLRKLAEGKGLYMGAAVKADYLTDPRFIETLTNNFNYITLENDLKWEVVHPTQTQYDFSGAEKIVKFALLNNMKVRGHTLVWHQQNPAWLVNNKLLNKNAQSILKNHIFQVVGHFKGKIRDWDVINDPLTETGEIRQNIWHSAIGQDYIELALRWANKADPKAKLFVNEHGCEWPGKKSDAFYLLVKDLKERGVPIHGVGLKFHLDGMIYPDFGSIALNFKRFSDLGLEIQLTELDVRLQEVPNEKMFAQQSAIYSEVMKVALAYKACTAFITWGVSDNYSWIPGYFKNYGYGLLFDNNSQAKPAAVSVQNVLAGARPAEEYFSKFIVNTNTRLYPPFRGCRSMKLPVIDGVLEPVYWEDAYVYSLMFNQLDLKKKDPGPSQSDIYGTWRVSYQGSKIVGVVTRKDDVTVTNQSNPWENDNFELFYNIGGKWKQIRTVVGQGWQKDNNVAGKAVWSKDGEILEFVVDTGVDLTGKTLGWSAALSDNDTPGSAMRNYQLYSVAGNNTGWLGYGYGEITFQNEKNEFIAGEPIGSALPFITSTVAKAPDLDGNGSDPVWTAAHTYPFAFNQFSKDQSIPLTGRYPGVFKLLVKGNTVFGLVQLAENATSKYNSIEFIFSLEGNTIQLTTSAGKDFIRSNKFQVAQAVWSQDKKTLEFMAEVSSKPLTGKKALFSIGLLDMGRLSEGLTSGLFPFCGYNRLITRNSKGQSGILSEKNIDLAEIVCQ